MSATPQRRGPGISKVEHRQILALLSTIPLPEVRRRTGRSFITLARIAASEAAR